jgi:hypothetical protein
VTAACMRKSVFEELGRFDGNPLCRTLQSQSFREEVFEGTAFGDLVVFYGLGESHPFAGSVEGATLLHHSQAKIDIVEADTEIPVCRFKTRWEFGLLRSV